MSQKKIINLPIVKRNTQTKKKNHNINTKKTSTNTMQLFKGNIANNMKFGNPGDVISGYVQREVVIIDYQGNKQIAREKQFFNSGKNIHVKID